ncbi:MAG: hypothetical protein GF355_08485 [Candidatus Eisenbacteria bacterium]|nr:hypothetical protein [Candidatus Eisenbacteria bacterium]
MLNQLHQLRFLHAILALVMALATAHACELEPQHIGCDSTRCSSVEGSDRAVAHDIASSCNHSAGPHHEGDGTQNDACCSCICHVPVTPAAGLGAHSEPAPTMVAVMVAVDPSSHIPEPIEHPPTLG